jgi:hypothetical protein
MPTTQSRTTAKAGKAATTAPKPTVATEHRQRGRVRARIHGLAQRGQTAAVAKNHHDDGGCKRDDHGPHARHRRNRRAAEALLGQEREVETRQNEKRHCEIDRHDHAERQSGNDAGGRRAAAMAVMNLSRIELARRGGAFAHVFIVGGRVGLHRSLRTEAFAAAARCLLGAIEPPQSKKPSMISSGREARPGAAKVWCTKNASIAFWIERRQGAPTW